MIREMWFSRCERERLVPRKLKAKDPFVSVSLVKLLNNFPIWSILPISLLFIAAIIGILSPPFSFFFK